MQLKNTIDTNMFPQSIGLEEIVNARELGGSGGVNPAYLEKVLDVIEERYGSLEGYLEKEIGITEEKRFRLREMYLEA